MKYAAPEGKTCGCLLAQDRRNAPKADNVKMEIDASPTPTRGAFDGKKQQEGTWKHTVGLPAQEPSKVLGFCVT